MSRPEERGSHAGVMAPLIATERLFESGAYAMLAMQTAVGRATLAATRRQLELMDATADAGSTTARRTADEGTDAAEPVATTAERPARAVEAAGEATEELVGAYTASHSSFDRFLDATAPFTRPAGDDRG